MSSEAGYDWLKLYVDGVLQTNKISGEVDWQPQAVNIPSGVHTVRWDYVKDRAVSSGLDAAWVDQVIFAPSAATFVWLELLGGPTNGKCQLILHGLPFDLFKILASTNLVDWSTVAVVATTNAAMPFLAPALSSKVGFYRLLELPLN